MKFRRLFFALTLVALTLGAAEVPVKVAPIFGQHGMVVAGHPQATAAGLRALQGRGWSLAVDVSSGVEAIGADGRPTRGIKDANRIHEFVAAVRAVDALLARHPNP